MCMDGSVVAYKCLMMQDLKLVADMVKLVIHNTKTSNTILYSDQVIQYTSHMYYLLT